MINNPIDLKYVFRRNRHLAEKESIINETVAFPNLDKVSKKKDYANILENYMRKCTSYHDALIILERLYTDNRFDLLEAMVQRVINDVIPITENYELEACKTDIKRFNIGNINQDKLIETVNIYKTVDRIRKNDKNIQQRFELNESSITGKNDREKVFHVCKMIETFSSSNEIKFNVALEEVAYLTFLEGDQMSDVDIAKNVVDYFLLIDENSEEDIKKYRKSILNSKVLGENADKNIPYLMGLKEFSHDFEEEYHNWLIDSHKDINELCSIVIERCGDIKSLNYLIERINEYSYVNDKDINVLDILNHVGYSSTSENQSYNIGKLINENHIKNTDDLIDNLKAIWESETNDRLYADDTEEPQTFTSDKINKFKMHNLIVDSQAVGEFLDHMEKTSMREPSIKIKRDPLAKIDHLREDSNIVNNIDPNGYLTMRLRSYVVEGNVQDIKDFLEQSMNCINNILQHKEHKVYYSINEDSFDVYIRSKYKVLLSESEEYNQKLSESDIGHIYNIRKYCDALENICESGLIPIVQRLENDKDLASTISVQEVSLIYELLNPYIDRENNFMNEFIEACVQEANPQSGLMMPICKTIKEEPLDLFNEYNIDRIKLCEEVLSAETKDNIKNKASKVKDTVKNTGNNIAKSIKDLKLVWGGIKSKVKNASAKEKEICRDLDVEFNHLVRSLNGSNSHREEIITGEVNRSLSKIIKMGIAVAGASVVNPVAGVIAAIGVIGSFAKSKFLSSKDKKMILDEIDVELKVLDREISRAESEGSTAKYRELLTIQKNLQRKRQEIYYGLARTGQRIPLQPTVGLRKDDD